MLVVVVWWKVIIVSALSLPLRDKDRLKDMISREQGYFLNVFLTKDRTMRGVFIDVFQVFKDMNSRGELY